MKKLFICIMLLFLACGPVYAADNDAVMKIEYTSEEVKTGDIAQDLENKFEEGTVLVTRWKQEIKEIKKDGLSLDSIFDLLGLTCLSLIFVGICLLLGIEGVKFITPNSVDGKLDVAGNWIQENLIKGPIKVLTTLRKKIRKK